jgi:hypothetical protein
MRRVWFAATTAGALVLVAPAARGAGNTQPTTTCSDAYVRGQELKQRHALLGARDQLLVCARPPCPSAFQPECAEWLAAVQKAIPSIVIAARGANGHDIADAQLYVDGHLLAERLDGKSVELDPGPHALRVTTRAGASVTADVVLNEGEKDRVVVLEFTASEPDARPATAGTIAPSPAEVRPASPNGGAPVLAYVSAGFALAAGGVGTYFGLSGVSERSHCTPHCSDTVRHDVYSSKFPIADVSFAVAALAAGLAVYFFWTAPRHDRASAAEPFVLRF